MSIIKIGNREVIFSNLFLIPHGETAFFSCRVAENDMLNCHIEFTYDSTNTDDAEITVTSDTPMPAPKLQVDFENGNFKLKFKNFNSSVGSTFSKPFIFAESDDGRDITLLAHIRKLKEMVQLNLQVMLSN